MGIGWSLPISPSMPLLDWLPFGYSGVSQLAWTLWARRYVHKERHNGWKRVRNNWRVRWGPGQTPEEYCLVPLHRRPLTTPRPAILPSPVLSEPARAPDRRRVPSPCAPPTQPHLGFVGEEGNVDFRQRFDDFGCSRFYQLIKQGIWTSCKNDRRQGVTPSTCWFISTGIHIRWILYLLGFFKGKKESSSHSKISSTSRVEKE